jgi:hypothetical protein
MLDGLEGVAKWWYERKVAWTREGWYCPDFLVKLEGGQFVWIEVKGPEPTRVERMKCQSLAKTTKQDVFIVWEGGTECLWFRAGGGSGERVGGLAAVVDF